MMRPISQGLRRVDRLMFLCYMLYKPPANVRWLGCIGGAVNLLPPGGPLKARALGASRCFRCFRASEFSA